MSAQLLRRKKRHSNKLHHSKVKDNAEYRARKAREQAERRRRRRVSESLSKDEMEELSAKNALLVKRTASQQTPTVSASDRDDVVAEDDASDDENEDDFCDEPDFDDEESANEEWTTENLQRVHTRCIGNDRRLICMTGLPCAVYADLYARVEPVLRHTRYDGKPRLQVRSNSRMPDELQFFLFAMWLRQVSTRDCHFRKMIFFVPSVGSIDRTCRWR
jgi:hypothetical protein